jgi:hypothetical protein
MEAEADTGHMLELFELDTVDPKLLLPLLGDKCEGITTTTTTTATTAATTTANSSTTTHSLCGDPCLLPPNFLSLLGLHQITPNQMIAVYPSKADAQRMLGYRVSAV